MASQAKNDKAVMAFALLLVVCCCCSCSSSALALAGKGTDPAPAPGPGPAPPSTPAPASAPSIDFITHKTGDRISGDILVTGNTTLEQCKAKCKVNDDCAGISYHAVDKICYEKGSTGTDESLLDINYTAGGYQFYYKIPTDYEIQGAGDRRMGDLAGMPVTKNTLLECSDVCKSKTECTGFSYNNKTDQCYAKKVEGLETEYKQNGFQFYRKK